MLNLANLQTPGVYIDEVPTLPSSVAAVETAIPAFIGYTQVSGATLANRPIRITSLTEYVAVFGARLESFEVKLASTGKGVNSIETPPASPSKLYSMYYAMQMYFANGGGPCYVVSIGAEGTTPTKKHHTDGLAAIAREDEPTLLVFPDLQALEGDNRRTEYYDVYKTALDQCNELKDRFVIIDIHEGEKDFTTPNGDDVINNATTGFRTLIGNNFLLYGAAYYPNIETGLNYNYDESEVKITGKLDGEDVPAEMVMRIANPTDVNEEKKSLFHSANSLYHDVRAAITNLPVVLPPSSTMAGVYAKVDDSRGVWKAPANVSLNNVRRPMVKIDDAIQEGLNVHPTGKSVNAIRAFTGKGILVWGARTLAGNDNEWRYVSVRRFFNMVEESVKKASEPFVFEPNDANTWNMVRSMIENFLTLQWRAGALQGAKPEDAYFVRVGLGQTMTTDDIFNGRMIVEIGMAVVRPAEFIVLRFTHKLPVVS